MSLPCQETTGEITGREEKLELADLCFRSYECKSVFFGLPFFFFLRIIYFFFFHFSFLFLNFFPLNRDSGNQTKDLLHAKPVLFH